MILCKGQCADEMKRIEASPAGLFPVSSHSCSSVSFKVFYILINLFSHLSAAASCFNPVGFIVLYSSVALYTEASVTTRTRPVGSAHV